MDKNTYKINIKTALRFPTVNTGYQDSKGRDICGSCRSHYVVSPEELREVQDTVNIMYDALKSIQKLMSTEFPKFEDFEKASKEPFAKMAKALNKADGK